MINTEKYIIVMGVNEGYFHKNENKNPEIIVGKIWQEEAKKYFEINNIYISAVITSCVTVYNTDWGCPEGGEITVSITCMRNPEFCNSESIFENAVNTVVSKVKKTLKQSTTTIEKHTIMLNYVKEEE